MAEHTRDQADFLETELKPRSSRAVAGDGHVFFVDAAHFAWTVLCCSWSFARIFVRAASGRQRFNVLRPGRVAWRLIAGTDTTVVNIETMCQLLREIAVAELGVGRSRSSWTTQRASPQRGGALAKELGITLLYSPSYSPNLNLIERLWKFTERRALYGRYHPTFAEFRAAIQEVLDGLSTTHVDQLKTLMTLKFQPLKMFSLMAA